MQIELKPIHLFKMLLLSDTIKDNMKKKAFKQRNKRN